jgi:hypothetical protein
MSLHPHRAALRLAATVLFMLCAGLATLAAPARARDRATAEEVAAFTDLAGALLGLRFTLPQREQIARAIGSYAERGEHARLPAVRNGARWYLKTLDLEPAPRAAAFRMARPDALLGLRKDQADGDALAALLLALYHADNPVLAPGKGDGLPLTRDMVDAQLDLQHFLSTEIHRRATPVPDAAAREAAVREAVRRHASLTGAQQVALARQPGELARVRTGWERASPLDRALTREQMGVPLTPQERAAVQQYAAQMNTQLAGLVAQHRQGTLGAALQGMRENSETIMGRGTVWNPATNRWEQQGGIVTEYNGTVRVP